MSKPETVFKAGPVRASIFMNVIERNGREIPMPKVVLEVRYKDKNGDWKGTNSLALSDIPKAILALQKAFDYLVSANEMPATEAPSEPVLQQAYAPEPVIQERVAYSEFGRVMPRQTMLQH